MEVCDAMKRAQAPSTTDLASNGGDARIRAGLRGVAQASDDVLRAVEAVGLRQAASRTPHYSLNSLDRRLPKRDVYDFLLACETLATVTGPTLLASGGARELRARAHPLLHTARLIQRATRDRPSAGDSGATLRMNGVLLYTAFTSPQGKDALARLAERLSDVTSGDGEQIAATRFELRLGTRFLVPGSVIAITLGLIFFFLSGIAFATGAINFSRGGIALSSLRAVAPTPNSAATATATAMVNSPTATTPSGGAPTQAPPSKAPSGAALSIAPASIQPCAGSDTQFTLSYAGGSSATAWRASSPDTANIALSLDGTTFTSSVSGALQPGASITVYVRLLNDIPTSGAIAVTGSSGVKGASIRYDSANC